jgi:hypothetical protein
MFDFEITMEEEMANFFKPRLCNQLGYSDATSTQTIGIGEFAEVALWGGDDEFRLRVRQQDRSSIGIEELPSYTPEWRRLSECDPNTRIFRVYGRKEGTETEIVANRKFFDQTFARMTVKVVLEPITGTGSTVSDLLFNGQQLVWGQNLPNGMTKQVFNATSGAARMSENGSVVDRGNQREYYQTASYLGPIPKGVYRFLARVDPMEHSTTTKINRDGSAYLDTREGIQRVVITDEHGVEEPYYAWGNNRVRLTPISTSVGHRGGFYLHDSRKGDSHGCIEVASPFFTLLRRYAVESGTMSPTGGSNKAWLSLEVKYGANASTYGHTWRRDIEQFGLGDWLT